ncbi:hypothetical protein BDV59DRAFT_211901 [Aspergillus ambiguus]|uniref:DUF3176 domain-containing protein n=1 Tax=Aspergillus ambiguus TaxID=176160 RepID=UPI003CCD46EB
MAVPEKPDKAEEERFLSKPHSARIYQLAAPFRNGFSKWNSLILDTWMWEIVSMTLSTLWFLAMVIVLRYYDQKELPSFPQGLTLNTIISILATSSKSALLCTIGTSVGQLKWLWFSGGRERPLYDLQSFDDASRGPWGSMMALMRRPRKGHFLISLAATITMISFAFDPFTQQILKFPVRQAPSDSSIATAKQAILPWIPMNGETDEAMINAINAGIYSTEFELDPMCPSGNCIWPPFQSAGWCNKCEDVTSQATLVGCDIASFNISRYEDQTVPCNITFPDGSWINSDVQGFWNETAHAQVLSIPSMLIATVNNQIDGPYLNQTILGVYSPLSAFVFIKFAVDSAFVAETYPAKELPKLMEITRATECVLSPCVRTYDISVSGGVPSTQTSLPEFGEIFHPEDYPGLEAVLQLHRVKLSEEESERITACWKPEQGGSVDVLLTEETWPITSNLWNNDLRFAGCPVSSSTYYDFLEKICSSYVYNASGQTWRSAYWSPPEGDLPSASLLRVSRSNFSYIMGNIAASMTKYARDLSNQTAYGTVYESRTYVSVDWAFLTLPAALILFGFVFLASTITVNSRQNLSLWKTSLFPVLYHGLSKDMDVDDFVSVSSMERKAQEITLKLEVSNTGMRKFVVQNT